MPSNLRLCTAVLCLFAIVPAPLAAPAFGLVDLEGRWTADGRALVLDLAPCGRRFCAIVVNPDKTCGATVLQMDRLPSQGREDEGITLQGVLDLPGEGRAYAATVEAGLDPDGKLAMDLHGYDKAQFEIRSYPFEARLMRTGAAVCRGGPAS